MKFSTDSTTLDRTLSKLRGVTAKGPNVGHVILENVMLRLEDDTLSITATNTETEIETGTPVTRDAPGAITVPARRLMAVCQALPKNAPLEIELDDARFNLRSGRTRYQLSTRPVDEFPAQQDADADATKTEDATIEITVAKSALRQLLELTTFAIARQDMRAALNGLKIEIAKDSITAAGTDGHRLAVARTAADTGVESPKSFIVPKHALTELTRMLGGEDSEVTLRVEDNLLEGVIDGTRISSKLIEDRFPDYTRVIPDTEASQVCLSLDRDALHQTVSRVAVLATGAHHVVQLEIEPKALRLTSRDENEQSASDELETDYEGKTMRLGFNAKYLLEALTILPSDQVELHFTDASSSCLIQPPSGAEDCRIVLMPIRL